MSIEQLKQEVSELNREDYQTLLDHMGTMAFSNSSDERIPESDQTFWFACSCAIGAAVDELGLISGN